MEFGNALWRKSSFSTETADCVEVAWRKSSFSGTETNCVEVAWSAGIRDSKNPHGGHLTVPDTALHQLIRSGPTAR
jgi:hypothetical protein